MNELDKIIKEQESDGYSSTEFGRRTKAATKKWIERYKRENKKKIARHKRTYRKTLDRRVRTATKAATMPKRKSD